MQTAGGMQYEVGVSVPVSLIASWFPNPLQHLLCAAGIGSLRPAATVCMTPLTHMHLFAACTYLACYLDRSNMTVDIADEDTTAPPSHPQCILVIHNAPTGQGHHFSSFVTDP